MSNKKDIDIDARIKFHQETVHKLKEFDIWESRFINSCLVGKNQGVIFGKDKYCPVDIHKFAELSNLHYGKAFDKALEAATKLCAKIFIPREGNRTTLTSIIWKVDADKDIGTILVLWDSDFIPLISGHMVAGEFISPRIAASAFQSNRRYCLYLLLEENLHILQKQDNFTLTKQEIRHTLGLKEGEYSEFKMVNAKIIKPALKDMYNKFGIPLTAKISSNRVIFSYEKR